MATKVKGIDLDKTFAANLARARKASGMSLRALGDKAGVTGVYIYQIEQGMRHPTLVNIGKIASALGLPVTSMLTPPKRG